MYIDYTNSVQIRQSGRTGNRGVTSGLRELILEQIPFLEKEIGENGEESQGKKRIKLLVGLFLISCF